MILIRFSLIASLLLTACAHAPPDSDELNCSNVKEGMKRAQVIEVLGSPDSSEKCGKKEEMLSWDGIRVAFSNDIVVSKFETDEAFFFKINARSVVTEIPRVKKIAIAQNPRVPQQSSIEFQVLQAQVKSVLEHKGYIVVENDEDHQVVVFVETSISRSSTQTNPRTYTRNLVMNAVSSDQPGQAFWRVSLSSDGKSNNLRAALPYLVVAAEEFIEKTVQDSKTFVFQNDPRVKAMSTRTPSSTVVEP